MPLVDIKNIPSFESTVFEQESPDDDEPPICNKGWSVGCACKSLKSNYDGTCEPAHSLFDTIEETSTSNENKVWHEGWLSQSTSLSEIENAFVVPAGILRKNALLSSRSAMMYKFLFLVHLLLVVLIETGSLYLLHCFLLLAMTVRIVCISELSAMLQMQTIFMIIQPIARIFGGNAISKVESQYSGTNNMAFLCYSASFADEKKMQHMMCFSIPQPTAFKPPFKSHGKDAQCRSLRSAQE
jgi:hypothetical protein